MAYKWGVTNQLHLTGMILQVDSHEFYSPFLPNGLLITMVINDFLSGMILQVSHEQNPLTFYYTGCLTGILIMVY